MKDTIISSSSAQRAVSCGNSLSDCVHKHVKQYLSQLEYNAARKSNIYDTALTAFDKGILEVVLEKCRGNKSEAARLLGMSRVTLCKKLQHVKIIDES